MKPKTKVVKKHRHKWERDIVDCPICGGGEFEECECGEIRKPKSTSKK